MIAPRRSRQPKRAASLCPEDPLIAPVVGIWAALQGERDESRWVARAGAQSKSSTWTWARRELEAAIRQVT